MRALVFASLLALAACDTATVDTESADAAGIVGTWDWERSTYYETASGQPVTHTPAAAGYTETYAFAADGSVDRCETLIPSAYPTINERYCATLLEKGDFIPARDAAGQAVDSVLHLRHQFVIRTMGVPRR